MRLPSALITLTSSCLMALSSQASNIGVVGLLPGKAILVVDGAPPKTYKAGDKIDSETQLLDANRDGATLLINGKKRVLGMNSQYAINSSSSESQSQTLTLKAAERGHFFIKVGINNQPLEIRMLIDTGATLVTIPAELANRLGIPYQTGRRGISNTANGQVASYLIKLDTLKLGGIELNQVDAAVQETGLDLPLLGMSALNRLDIKQSGDQMNLSKRY